MSKITLKTLVEELGLVGIKEVYHFECGHKEIENMILDYAQYSTVCDYESFNIDYDKGMLYVHLNTTGKCATCELFEDDEDEVCERIYCDEMPRPEGFEDITLYHGLAAFSGTVEANGAAKNAINIIEHPEYQICCATDAIGPMGLIIKGTVITASNIDLCSSIDKKTCRRYYDVYVDDNRACKGIIHHASQLQKQWSHNEIITMNNCIPAVWIYDWADNDYKKIAKDLANKYNIELVVIPSEDYELPY